MHRFGIVVPLLFLCSLSRVGVAGIAYSNPGSIAPANTFVSPADGPVYAYFYNSDASLDSVIGMWVNGVFAGTYGLPNHHSNEGDSLLLGTVHANDTLVFELRVLSNGRSWFSDPTWNTDST